MAINGACVVPVLGKLGLDLDNDILPFALQSCGRGRSVDPIGRDPEGFCIAVTAAVVASP